MSVVHWSITKGDFCDLEDADITCYQMLQDLLNLKYCDLFMACLK